MNHLLSLSLLVCFCYVTAFPVDVNLNLKNICPAGIFSYKKSVVNSYYGVPLDYKLWAVEGNAISENINFKEYFDVKEVARLENYRDQFNDEINKLLSDETMRIDNFVERNFTVNHNRLNEIKKAFESVPSSKTETNEKESKEVKETVAAKEEKKNEENKDDKKSKPLTGREKQLKSCIDTVDSGLKLVKHFKSFQTEFLPEGDMTAFNQSIEELVTKINKNTEQLVFTKEELLERIHQIGIFKPMYIQSDNRKFTIGTEVFVPMYNLNYDSFECVDAKELPVFYKSKGKTGVNFTANGWASTHLNFNMFALIQLSILYYFIKSKF